MKQESFQSHCFDIQGVAFFQMLNLFIDSPGSIIVEFPRSKSLLKIAYVTFVILKSHDFFSLSFCDFIDC